MKKKSNLLLMSLLALNASSSVYSNTIQENFRLNENRLYNNMLKKLKNGKSNRDNYRIIEKILHKRNKELNDLYIQSNYIVKPEFLEWQVFISGFYYNRNGGGSGGKNQHLTYAVKPKEINLGLSSKDLTINKNLINLNLSAKNDFIPPIKLPDINIYTPILDEVNNTTLPLFALGGLSGIQGIDTQLIESTISKTGEIADIESAFKYYENNNDLSFDGSAGSSKILGKSMSLFNLETGKINNKNIINMQYNRGAFDQNFVGIHVNNTSKYVDFENNGSMTISDIRNPLDKIKTIGLSFSETVLSENPQELTPDMFNKNSQKIILADGSESQGAYIQNYGYINLNSHSNWVNFSGKDLDYVSHLPNKNVGNLFIDNNSLGLKISSTANNGNTNRRIDPGILMVTGNSIGITANNTGILSIFNLNNNTNYDGFTNTSLDKSKDSQIILRSRVEGNNILGSVGLDINSSDINSNKVFVDIPIYMTGLNTFGLILKGENTEYLLENDIKFLSSPDDDNSIDTEYGSTIYHNLTDNLLIMSKAIQIGGGATVINKGNISNLDDESHEVSLNNGDYYSFNGNSNGINNNIGVSIENSKYIQAGGSIKIGGRFSIGLTLTGGEAIFKDSIVEIKNGAYGFINSKGTVLLSNSTFNTDSYGSLFVVNKIMDKDIFYDFQGENTASVKETGTAFVINGDADLFGNFKNLKNLKLNLEKDSVLLSFISTIPNINSSEFLPLSDFNLESSLNKDYYTLKFSSIEGTFNVNQNENLDGDNSILKKALYLGTKVIVNNNNSLSGSKEKTTALKGLPLDLTSYGLSYIKSSLENNGIIDLSGSKSIGMSIEFGESKNSNLGEIKVTGTNGVGMYGENSSTLLNDGNITIGSNNIGIYGISYKDPENIQTYGTGTINVTNNGNITAQVGEGAVGIYINNNKPTGAIADSTLNLDGKIDVSKSEKGVGLYVNKTLVNGTNSEITVGKGGVGIYAKDSDINLSNLNLNLYGDNALGIFLEGNTVFNGTGNIDIRGKGVLLYNIGSSVVFNNNLTVSASPDSSYVIGKLDGRTTVYNGTANLDSNGILFLGGNSAALLDTASIINGTGINIAAIALSGQGTPDPLWNTTADGTNRGQINLSNNSMGMYGEEGTRLLNDATGLITVDKEGAALYTQGADSFAINSGQINLGESSHGIYLGDSIKNVTNTTTGQIKGTASGIIGIFTHEGSAETTNEGQINLTGDKVTGIYNSGTGNTVNKGQILIGDSVQKENPGIGIYGINNTINNTGNIITGANSLGIYNSEGITNQNGRLSIGSGGTGIYTSGGTVNLEANSVLNLDSGETTGVYGKSGTHIINNSTINTETGNIVFGLEDNSSIQNNKGITLKGDSVFIYSSDGGIIENSYGADIIMSGSDNTGIYSKNGGSILNKGNITGDTGTANTGIYNNSGSIENHGNIKLGDSLIVDKEKPYENSYSVGIYGSKNTLFKNYGDIEVGETGIGIYSKDGKTEALNKGNISSLKNEAIGIYIENSILKNEGNITLSGKDSIGIAVGKSGILTNAGIITMNGESNIGIYASVNSKVINNGKININGNNSTGVQLLSGSTLENNGEINIAKSLTDSKDIINGETGYIPPSIINAGIIKVDEKFEINGLDLTIKVDPNTIRIPTLEEIKSGDYDLEDLNGGFLVSNNVSIKAPSFNLNGNTVKIDPLFTQKTNARVYKFENVFDPTTPEGGPNSGEISVASGSLTFDAVPVINKKGGVDIWMEKINYNKFTQGSWQNEFAENIEGRYLNAKGNLLKLYDRLDLITEKRELNKRFGELSGEIYSNMNQREIVIGDLFEDSLNLLRNSKNNTKENAKINIIAGKGKSTEETSGVPDYNYTTTGVQILREVERTYRHTFGYSLGYAHTNFEFEDGNKSKELADTIQLGVHNKYMLNSWELRNDLTGRVSLYNIDRNINWNDGERSELNGHYETYSLTIDNRFGKELSLGIQASITPYGGIKAIYMTRDSFKEKGTEGLDIKGNDAWSLKPRAGVELKGNLPLGLNTGWYLKGSLDIAYEYELAGLEKEERAKLSLLEDNYHKLAKSEEDKGKLRTRTAVGVEIEDRYGLFLTGEYNIGNHNKDDYRAGLAVKAVF